MDDPIFVQKLVEHDLLPGNTKATLQSKPTPADKADYFLDIVERGVEINLPKLFAAMEEHSRDCNDAVLSDLVGKMQGSLLGKSTYLTCNIQFCSSLSAYNTAHSKVYNHTNALPHALNKTLTFLMSTRAHCKN